MTRPEPHTVAVELSRLLPAITEYSLAVVSFNLDRLLAFIDDVSVQDSSAGMIQQSLDQ